MNKEELKEKYYLYRLDKMVQRDETKNHYFRKYLNGVIFVCAMILEDIDELKT